MSPPSYGPVRPQPTDRSTDRAFVIKSLSLNLHEPFWSNKGKPCPLSLLSLPGVQCRAQLECYPRSTEGQGQKAV